MDNQTQPAQENLTTFTQNMLTHAIQPLSRGEQALAATLTMNASAEEEKLAQEYLLHQILAANLFASEMEAQAYSNNLLQNMKKESNGKSLQQMMAAAAFLAAQSAQQKSGGESYEIHMPGQTQPQYDSANMHTPVAPHPFPRQQRMQQQPQQHKEEVMPGKDKTKLPTDAFNVQNAKQKTADRRNGAAQTQGQPGQPGQQQQPDQNQPQQNQNQRRQEETQATQPQQKKGGGLFKKVFVGAGVGGLVAGGIGGLTIFNVIQ